MVQLVPLVLLESVYLDLLDLMESQDRQASLDFQVSHLTASLGRVDVTKQKQICSDTVLSFRVPRPKRFEGRCWAAWHRSVGDSGAIWVQRGCWKTRTYRSDGTTRSER